jgi:hypothetical protein
VKRTALATPSIAPSYPLSHADRAAHDKASYVRPTAGWFPTAADPGDSDPDMDEALRRATAEVAYIERDTEWQVEYHGYLAACAA